MKNTDISNEFIIKVSPEDYKFLVNNQGKDILFSIQRGYDGYC